jgi:hypothetical protein
MDRVTGYKNILEESSEAWHEGKNSYAAFSKYLLEVVLNPAPGRFQ